MQLTKAVVAETSCINCYWFCNVLLTISSPDIIIIATNSTLARLLLVQWLVMLAIVVLATGLHSTYKCILSLRLLRNAPYTTHLFIDRTHQCIYSFAEMFHKITSHSTWNKIKGATQQREGNRPLLILKRWLTEEALWNQLSFVICSCFSIRECTSFPLHIRIITRSNHYLTVPQLRKYMQHFIHWWKQP